MDYDLQPGRMLAGKYEVVRLIGKGYEGEVYLVNEVGVDLLRAAKLYYEDSGQVRFTVRKLEKLRRCAVMMQYQTQERIRIRNQTVPLLVSEFIDGELLMNHVKKFPGARMQPFEALHMLYALAKGMACVHAAKDYHGDIHDENIIVRRRGIHYEVRLIDVHDYGKWTRQHMADDVTDMVRVLYDVLGGQKRYAKMPQEIKDICCGLKRSLITHKFPDAQALVRHLGNFTWE